MGSHSYDYSNLVFHKLMMLLVRDQRKLLVWDQLTSCGDGGFCSRRWGRVSSSCMLGQGGNRNWGRLGSHSYDYSNLVFHKLKMLLVRDQRKLLVGDQLTFCGGDGFCSHRWGRGSSSCMLGRDGNHNWGRLDSHIHGVHSNLVSHKLMMLLVRDQLTSCGGGECHSHNHTRDILVYILPHICRSVVMDGGRTVQHKTQDGVHIQARDPHLASPH